MRRLAVIFPVLALVACGPSDAPLFNRQSGMWKVEMQVLTPAGSLISAEQRAQMDPAAFAQMQADMARIQQVEAPRCVDGGETYAHNLTQFANQHVSTSGCEWTRNEVTASSYSRDGICTRNGEAVPMSINGTFSDSVITTTLGIQPPTESNQPPPAEIRIKIIETRTGDCT